MKKLSIFLPFFLFVLASALLAQSTSERAPQARAKDDSVRARRTTREARSRDEERDRLRSVSRHEWRAGIEEARQAAELARETMEDIDLDAIMETARLSAEIAGAVVGDLDLEEITEHAALAADLAGEALEEMELFGPAELSGLAELHELSAELAMMPPFDIPPIPPIPPIAFIPPTPAIPPIGPLPPPAPVIAYGPRWHGEWHASPRQYRQYLSEDEEVRLNALRVLLEQDEKLALPEARKLLRDENWAIRAATLEMLRGVDSKEAVGILRDALRSDTDKRVKRAAVRALSHREEPEAREALEEVLQK